MRTNKTETMTAKQELELIKNNSNIKRKSKWAKQELLNQNEFDKVWNDIQKEYTKTYFKESDQFLMYDSIFNPYRDIVLDLIILNPNPNSDNEMHISYNRLKQLYMEQ